MPRTATDAETRIASDDHAAIRLWLRMLATNRLIETRMRRLLQERFETTLPRFDLMAQLEREPQGLSMSELSRRMMVTGGNVTSIVDQLEKEQLVQRQMQASDRRSFTVSLTEAGRTAFAAMAQAHEGWVVDLLSPLAALAMSPGNLGPAATHSRSRQTERMPQAANQRFCEVPTAN